MTNRSARNTCLDPRRALSHSTLLAGILLATSVATAAATPRWPDPATGTVMMVEPLRVAFAGGVPHQVAPLEGVDGRWLEGLFPPRPTFAGVPHQVAPPEGVDGTRREPQVTPPPTFAGVPHQVAPLEGVDE